MKKIFLFSLLLLQILILQNTIGFAYNINSLGPKTKTNYEVNMNDNSQQTYADLNEDCYQWNKSFAYNGQKCKRFSTSTNDYEVKVDEVINGESSDVNDIITIRVSVFKETDGVVKTTKFNFKLDDLSIGDKLFTGINKPSVDDVITNDDYFEFNNLSILKLDQKDRYVSYIEDYHKDVKYDKIVKEIEKAKNNKGKYKKISQKEHIENIEENGVFTQAVEDDMLAEYNYYLDKYAEKVVD